MEKRCRIFVLSLLLGMFLLPSCGHDRGIPVPLNTKDASYRLYRLNPDRSIKILKDEGFYRLRRKDGYNAAAYVTIEDYLFFIRPLFREGIDYSLEDYGNAFLLYGEDEEPFFFLQATLKGIRYGGDLSYAFNDGKDVTTLSYRTLVEQAVLDGKGDAVWTSYNPIEFCVPDVSVSESQAYIPIGILDAEFSSIAGAYHVCGFVGQYYGLLQVPLEDGLDYQANVQGEMKTVREIMAYTYDESWKVDNKGLLRYSYDILSYVLCNHYGLWKEKGVDDPHQYFVDSWRIEEFARDAYRRTAIKTAEWKENYPGLFAFLDDGHSAPYNAIPWIDGEEPDYSKCIGPTWKKRLEEATQRKQWRESNLHKGVNIDPSHPSLALISFDSFAVEEDPFDENGTLKPSVKENDTFYALVEQFEECKKAGVKDIVLDCTLNGGGIIGVLYKILALISPDNSMVADMDYREQSTILRYRCRVDTNGDGQYDEDDIYGDDFHFYIMTSSFSYSCGNAFPFYAKDLGYAKILGEKSGGGECAVATSILPTGHVFSYSSNVHLGSYNKLFHAWKGSEQGVDPDIPLQGEECYELSSIAHALGL